MINVCQFTRYLCLVLLISIGLSSCRSSKPSRSSYKRPGYSRPSHSRSGGYAKTSKPTTKPGGTAASSQKADLVIRTARSYMGTPYKYGGTTKRGMDCSGLLCTSFKAADITLPRTSAEQSQFGSPVRISEIQPGDLVFFSERKGGKKVSHVGLVTDVRGSDQIIFIHSTNSRGVMEDDLFSEHYHKIFIKAVRPF